MRKHNGMRPQDVLILLKMTTLRHTFWRIEDLRLSLKLSASEVSEALDRCRMAKLVDVSKRKVHAASFLEFLFYGLKYAFPVQPAGIVRGIPTAYSAPPINTMIVANSQKVVWAYAKGTERGQAIEPLYKTVPEVVENDLQLYELLALVDTIRIGKVREVEIAKKELTKRIKNDGGF
ncbi:hypothetical protein [Parabacteroides gordonii]|uniref:hypothetical protein n=1 Tax=Parabacteroides gordonii TaxID=574930 RepID=UPI0026E99380|nr:hypothetical protein [Parabacteroides gordonii]